MLDSFKEYLEESHLLETLFVKIISYKLSSGYSHTYTSYNALQLCTLIEGQIELTINEKSMNYNTSQSILLPAHTQVFMDIKRPTKILIFEIKNELIQHVIEKTVNIIDPNKYINTKELLFNNQDIHITDSVYNLTEACKDFTDLNTFIIDLYAQKLIYDLLKSPQTGKQLIQQTSNPMDNAIQYMKQNLHQAFSLKELATLMNMSTSNLSHSFKKYTGISPIKYNHALKMKRGKEVLQTMTVTETAFELGYEAPSYFIQLFKTHFGYTPKKYQKGL